MKELCGYFNKNWSEVISGMFNLIRSIFELMKLMCLFCKGISIGNMKFHH